jgi:hypothetical protein
MHRHLTRNTAIFCSFFAIFAVGCSKKNDAPAPAASASAAASSAAVVDGGTSSMSDPVPGEGLGGRFAREAKSRPGLKPSSDDIFAALETAGVSLPKKTQSMGSTYKAAYCAGGYSADTLVAITICEYANEAEATAGRDFSLSLFPNMASRTVVAHKTNTMQLIIQKPGAPADAEKKKAVDTFNAL